MKPSISIISDWKQRDYYYAALRQRIRQYLPDADVNSISNQVESHDLMEAAFMLRAAWNYFPDNSIHLMCVKTEASAEHPHVLIRHKNQYFIGTDFGYWPFICKTKPDAAWILNDEAHYKGNSFPSLNVFAPVAAAIAKGVSPDELGETGYALQEAAELKPVMEKGILRAGIVYFDSYGNAITNLNKSGFEQEVGDKKFRMFLMSEQNRIHRISSAYCDVRPGSLVAVFNSQGLLEIAINEGNLKQLLNLRTGGALRIEYE